MSTTIATFANKILPEVPGCPNFLAKEKIVEAIRELCKDSFLWERGVQARGTVDSFGILTFILSGVTFSINEADSDSFVFDIGGLFGDVAPIAVADLNIDGVGWNLSYLDLKNDYEDPSEITISGTKFFNFPTEQEIKLFPFTDEYEAGDAINLYVKVYIKPLSTVTSIDDFFYYDHLETICAKAKSILQRMPGKDWTDFQQAAVNEAEYWNRVGVSRVHMLQHRVKGDLQIQGGFFC
jgi:hypothetical protein